MKRNTLKFIAASGLVLAGVNIPVIPQDMEFEAAYRVDCMAVGSPVKAVGSDEWVIPSKPTYLPDPCVQEAYLAVFKNKKGEKVYVEIEKMRYEAMQQPGGAKQNPKKAELLALPDLLK